jgi:hypothetical protein
VDYIINVSWHQKLHEYLRATAIQQSHLISINNTGYNSYECLLDSSDVTIFFATKGPCSTKPVKSCTSLAPALK